MNNRGVIVTLANRADELDAAGDLFSADRLDALIDKCIKRKELNVNDRELLAEVLSCDAQELDDGRFGLNDKMNPVYKAAELMVIADELDSRGMYREALVVEASFNPKVADLTQYMPPAIVADSLLRIFNHLMQRANISNRHKFLNSIKNGLAKINPVELSNKKNNPTSAIGAAINIVKNLLIGQDLNTVISVLDSLKRLI